MVLVGRSRTWKLGAYFAANYNQPTISLHSGLGRQTYKGCAPDLLYAFLIDLPTIPVVSENCLGVLFDGRRYVEIYDFEF